MDIDIIGFSRGAAEARDFANRIVSASVTQGGKTYYRYENPDTHRMNCQWINFRFMGLWDTVLSTNRSGYDYRLAIPSPFQHVARRTSPAWLAMRAWRWCAGAGPPGTMAGR